LVRPFNKSEMALFSECTDKYAQKLLDTADIVREAIFRKPLAPGWEAEIADPMLREDIADGLRHLQSDGLPLRRARSLSFGSYYAPRCAPNSPAATDPFLESL
jgi:hypothetical protein